MLDEVLEAMVNVRLEQAYFNDPTYQKWNKEEVDAIESFMAELAPEQRDSFDNVLDAKNASSSNCCYLAYKQGWLDCMELLVDLVVRNS